MSFCFLGMTARRYLRPQGRDLKAPSPWTFLTKSEGFSRHHGLGLEKPVRGSGHPTCPLWSAGQGGHTLLSGDLPGWTF